MRLEGTTVDTALRTLLRLVTAVAIAIAVGAASVGCAAPTLPLPPPTALLSTPDAEGVVTIEGVARERAIVMAFNEDRREGVIGEAGDDGTYTLRIAASIGETITVWQMVGADTSQLLSREVPSR